jgi:colanic acid biosynthesis glycosyl transferase WcaI
VRLLVFSNLYDPDHAGGAPIFTDLCQELAARGHEVHVRCAYPYFPEWRDKSGHNGLRIRRSVEHGVDVARYGLFLPRDQRSTAQRMLYEASLLASYSRSIFRGPPVDAVVAFSTMFSPVVSALAWGRLHRVPVMVNVQDMSSSAAVASGLVGGGAGRLLSWVERRAFAAADVLTGISPEMVGALEEMTGADGQVGYVPNWLNGSIAEAIDSLPSKQDRPPSDPLNFLYAGNIGNKQGLLEFCQAAHASDASFHLTIHGSGPGADAVQRWGEEAADPRFTFGPFLSEHDFTRALHDSDLFLITERTGSGTSYMPSKLIPAIATGTPILAVCDEGSSLGNEVRRFGIGPHLPWGAIDTLADLLRRAADGATLEGWRDKASHRAASYARTGVIDNIEEMLESAATRVSGQGRTRGRSWS